ncbi:putative diguanylate cyclase YdaM [Marinomonas aquimarina]|uniref:diguanylate cyclase n=1 Tax=Marinomonas aquimarina TaxID=295068 RepID=A0A1A8SZC6_9GAMM|nr:GGDEF domain-containing protein [Marinomonas aquimarina]SBS24541.1 putative diguanylate cyclase YdaM [Marinomonas aquimarina]
MPRRSAVQFILTKVVACYIAMAVVLLGGLIIWSYQQVVAHRADMTAQLQTSVVEAITQAPGNEQQALQWLTLGIQLSESDSVAFQSIALLGEDGHVVFAWPSSVELAATASSAFNLLDLQNSSFTLAVTYSDTLLEHVFKHDLLPVIALLVGQLMVLMLLLNYLVKRGIYRTFSSFMRELSMVNLRQPAALQADSFLGQFKEYRQVLVGVNRVILSLAKSREQLAESNQGLERHIHAKTAALEERNEELLILNKQLSIIANTDSLTQVYNRTRFDVLFKEHVTLSKRRATPLAILLVDLDDFKKVNDRFGHQTGDHVLKHAAHVIQREIGAEGVVARWGGEEFAVLLPYFDLAKAEEQAETLRAAIAKARFEEQAIKITTSIGVAQLGEQETAGQLLKRADDALYDAKGLGRNRVIIASLEQSHTQLELADGEFIEVLDVASEPTQGEPEVSEKLPT